MLKSLALVLSVLAWHGVATAQTALPVPEQEQVDVLVLDFNSLFRNTEYGRSVLLQYEKAAADLDQANRAFVVELEAEEASLSERRPTMSREEFQQEADLFDQKVQRIRAERDAAAEELENILVFGRARLSEISQPLIWEIMTTRGAKAVINKNTTIISADAIDITDELAARIDQILPAQQPNSEESE